MEVCSACGGVVLSLDFKDLNVLCRPVMSLLCKTVKTKKDIRARKQSL